MTEQTWEFVRASDADIPEILELTRHIHGDVGMSNPDYIRWLTVDNPAGSAINWVAKETTTGRVIAVVLGTARPMKYMERECATHNPSNLLTHPDFRRRGIITNLSQRAFDDYRDHGDSFGWGVPGPGLKKAWLKFQPIVLMGVPPLLLRPFDVGRILSGLGVPGRLLPGLANLGFRPFKALLRSHCPKQAEAEGLRLESIERFDASFDRFWERIKDKYDVIMVRNAQVLQWRYKDSALREYECLACRDQDGEVVGFIVYRNVRVNDVETGLILDLLVERSPRGQVAGLSLVAAATEAVERAGAAMAACRMLRHTDEYRLFCRQGYLPIPTRLDPWPLWLIGRSWSKDIVAEEFFRLERWFFTLGDWGIDAFSA